MLRRFLTVLFLIVVIAFSLVSATEEFGGGGFDGGGFGGGGFEMIDETDGETSGSDESEPIANLVDTDNITVPLIAMNATIGIRVQPNLGVESVKKVRTSGETLCVTMVLTVRS